MKKLRVLDIEFENEIQPWEVPAFRGAVIESAGRKNILFHNHKRDKFVYSYPLIQYKRIGKKPHLVCIDDGVDEIISTRRLCHIAQTFSIFGNRMKSIELCIARFDEDTKEAFLDLYTKVDSGIEFDEDGKEVTLSTSDEEIFIEDDE